MQTLKVCALCCGVLFASDALGAVCYVDDSATGANDGSSWQDAFTDLQSAIEIGFPGCSSIWVAAGTYMPSAERDPGGNNAEPGGVTFDMRTGLTLYGGLAGNEDPATFDLSTRDFVANETVRWAFPVKICAEHGVSGVLQSASRGLQPARLLGCDGPTSVPP